jgi:hypothetical protein
MPINTFEEYFNLYLKYDFNDPSVNSELLESSDVHFKYRQGENSIISYYNEKTIEKKLRLNFPFVLFITRFEHYVPQHNFHLDVLFTLYFSENEQYKSIDILVREIDNSLTFDIRLEKNYDDLAKAFLSEIKQLKQYRLLTITQ